MRCSVRKVTYNCSQLYLVADFENENFKQNYEYRKNVVRKQKRAILFS